MQTSRLPRTSCGPQAPGARQLRQRQRLVTAAAAADAPDARPSRGVLVLPGLGNNAADYAQLSERLRAQGLAVATVPISRLDWSRNALALTDGAWWRGALQPRPAVDWYLTRMDTTMQALKREVEGGPITILTHSAGGWLGRVYLQSWGPQGVDRFVSLGSPHLAPPQGVLDQTRGILTWVNDACPGAFHETITYTTVAGRFIEGVPLNGEGSALAKFAGAGYQQVCGQAAVWGDFIVPVCAAHLPGALNLDLDGVFHSPLGEQQLGPWYGSDNILPLWQWALDGSQPPVANQSSSSDTSTQPAAEATLPVSVNVQ